MCGEELYTKLWKRFKRWVINFDIVAAAAISNVNRQAQVSALLIVDSPQVISLSLRCVSLDIFLHI